MDLMGLKNGLIWINMGLIWINMDYNVGPRSIAKLVYKSNNYRLLYANNYSIHGVYKPTNITGGHHIVKMVFSLTKRI
jgi:hypothetical protein